MNAAPHTDEDFAHALRNLVDDVAPDVTVQVARVVPAARRHRARRRIAVSVASVGVLALATGWAVQAAPWAATSVVQPAGFSLPTDDGAAADDGAATGDGAAVDDPPSDAPVDPAAAGWPDARYWRVLSTETQITTDGRTSTETREGWFGRTDPGLIVVDGKVDDPDSLIAFGPSSWGRLTIDDVDTLIGWDALAALPADSAALDALLRANVEPDRDTGTPDDKVFKLARDLLSGSPAPVALRDALWQLMGTLPGSTVVGETQDSTGRAGVGVERTIEGAVYGLVYDPVAHRLLETSEDTSGLTDHGLDTWTSLIRRTFVEEGPADAPPVEPTLEMAGCTRWETC